MKTIWALLIASVLMLVAVRADKTSSEENSICDCDRMLFKVCGSDGVTYSNQCVMECRTRHATPKVTRVKFGPC